jgi:hypothetical protein
MAAFELGFGAYVEIERVRMFLQDFMCLRWLELLYRHNGPPRLTPSRLQQAARRRQS